MSEQKGKVFMVVRVPSANGGTDLTEPVVVAPEDIGANEAQLRRVAEAPDDFAQKRIVIAASRDEARAQVVGE